MPSAVGIELGPSAVRGAVLEQAGQRLQLSASREIACDTANPEALTRALTDLRRSLKISGPVVLGVPSASAILAIVHPLVAVKERAELAVQFELQQSLPFPLTDAAWHYHWVANGHGSAAMVAAMRRPLLEERLAACRRAGLSVQAVSLSPVAILNVCRLKSGGAANAPMTVLVVHGPSSAEWIAAAPGALHVVPVASDDPQRLWQDAAAVWAGLSQEPGVSPVIHVAGSAEAASAAQQALAGQTVQRLDLGSVIGKSPEPAFDAAAGLALHGLGQARLPLNLLAAFQQEARAQRQHRIAQMISACCLAAAAALGVNGMLEVRSRRAGVLDALEKRERLYQALRPDVRQMLQRQARIEQRAGQLGRLADQAPALTQALAQVAGTLPDDIWLTSVDLSKSGLIHGVVEGRARSFQDVTRFFESLKTAAGMTTVKPLSTSVTADPQGGESIAFGVQMQRPLPGEAPEPAPSKEKQKKQ